MVDPYVNYISDAEFKKYIKRQCEDLAIQSWNTLLHTTSLCDCCGIQTSAATGAVST